MGAANRGLHRFRDAVLSEYGPEDVGAKLVAVVMVQFADKYTLKTFVGAETIARCSGMNERTVRRHREQLEASGWLTSQASRRRGRGRQWHLLLPPGIPDKSPGNPARLLPDNFDRITGQKRLDYRTNRPPISSSIPFNNSGNADAPAPQARAPLEPGPQLPPDLARRLKRRAAGGAS